MFFKKKETKINLNQVKLEERHFEEALKGMRVSDQLVVKRYLNKLSNILQEEAKNGKM